MFDLSLTSQSQKLATRAVPDAIAANVYTGHHHGHEHQHVYQLTGYRYGWKAGSCHDCGCEEREEAGVEPQGQHRISPLFSNGSEVQPRTARGDSKNKRGDLSTI